MERLEASILNTVFRNEENGYSVLSVRSGRNEVTVVGVLPELAPGEQAVFAGEWVEHKTYGRQFKCASFEIQPPTTLLGIERYLASGIIRGIRESTAAQIVRYFGEETMTVLAEHPERLTELPGIGKKRAAMIAESFHEQQETRRTLIFLQSYGIPQNLSLKIAQFYGENAPELLRRNPYRLCEEIEGVGFRTADRIAISLGFPPDGEDRILAALKYTLQDASASSGHIYLPEEELLRDAGSLLGLGAEDCAPYLRKLLVTRKLIAEAEEDGSRRIYTPRFFRMEEEVAGRLRELMAAVPPERVRGAGRAVSAFERAHRITFSPRQRETIIRALESGVFVITGGPGTGKTTIIQCILELMGSDSETLLCAPTGRAARRMAEATGTESKTIHRLLEFSGKDAFFVRNEENPLEADCIIADEASMIDLPLMQALLRAMEPGMRLILVGDADQLPSVGPGNVLRDILDSAVIPHARLTDIFRQSETSRIALNAHLINEGQMPVLNERQSDFFFERKTSLPEAAATIVSLASVRLPAFLGYAAAGENAAQTSPARQAGILALSARNIQVLAPGKKGDCGVFALNGMLQEALNPRRAGSTEFTWGETLFRLGDKVIQMRNNYDLAWTTPAGGEGVGIFNGDIGFITHLRPEEHALTVLFDEEREVEYAAEDLDDLSLAYCLSVHKSQGSEFPVVILPVVPGPPMLLTRNLFYTALTRARSLVVLVGSEEVIRAMTLNDYVARRYTTLTRRLQEWTEDPSLL